MRAILADLLLRLFLKPNSLSTEFQQNVGFDFGRQPIKGLAADCRRPNFEDTILYDPITHCSRIEPISSR